jgi:hypothetical protein
MERKESQAKSRGIGFGGMLAILFIGLKLTGHIDWAWGWVLSPLWIPLGVAAAILLVAAVLVGIAAIGDAAAGRKGRR